MRRIAHAGGGVDGQSYTNSYQALNANLAKGFEYFELDFVFTNDNKLVCLHDWEGSYERFFGVKFERRLSYLEFLAAAQELKGNQPCTLDGLAVWLRDNPSAKIVTDIKERNLEGLAMIAVTLPDALTRVIPQIYQPEEYRFVSEIGFEQFIWTLYRYKGSSDQILSWTEHFKGAFAITMPKNTAKSSLPSLLADRHIPSYVHTVNAKAEATEFMDGFRISEIYTDKLTP